MTSLTLSLFALLALSLFPQTVVSVPQANPTTQAPILLAASSQDLNAPQGTAGSCNACFVVAQIAGVVWYSEVFQNVVATEFQSVALLANATGSSVGRVLTTVTSTVLNPTQITFSPNSLSGAPELQIKYAPTVTINGATLKSPTAYNIYSAYAISSETFSDNQCVTVPATTSTLATAYLQVLSTSAGVVYVDAQGEQNFIHSLGFTTCSGGGANVNNIALVQVKNLTSTVSQTAFTVPLAASRTLAPTTSASVSAKPASKQTFSLAINTATATISTFQPAGTAGTAGIPGTASLGSTTITSATTIPPAHAPLIIVGSSTTLTPVVNPVNLPFFTPSAIPTLTLVDATQPRGSNFLVIVPTGSGSGAGNYTATIVPYISEARTWREAQVWMSLWISGLFGLTFIMTLL